MFTLLNGILVKLHIVDGQLETIKQLVYNCILIGRPQLTVAMWFIQSLFWLSIGYALVEYTCMKCKTDSFKVQCVLACICLIAGLNPPMGGMAKVFFLFNGAATLKGYAMFHCGVVISRYNLKFERLPRWSNPLLFVASAAFLFFKPHYLPAALLGWMMIMALYQIAPLNLVSYVGRHTMPILIFHFLAFKLVNFCGTLYYDDPIAMAFGFPTTYHSVAWTVVYTFVGVALPFLINVGRLRLKEILR